MASNECPQGDDLDVKFPKALYADGTPVDLTGATLLCFAQGETSPAVSCDGATVDWETGEGRAWFGSGKTRGWKVGETFSYDGRVLLANGLLHTIGRGWFLVTPPTTPTP